MTMRTIIAAAFIAAITGLAPLPAASVEYNAFFYHCQSADKHQGKEDLFLSCIEKSIGFCIQNGCDRRFNSGSSEHQRCTGYCNEYASANRNLQSWRQ